MIKEMPSAVLPEEEKLSKHNNNDFPQMQTTWEKIFLAQEKGIPQLDKILKDDFDLDQSEELATNIIKQSTFEEIVAFLSKIKEHPNKHSLPQYLIDNVLEKFFSGWEKLPKDERDGMDGEDIMMAAITASHHYGKSKYASQNGQSITDKFFLSFVHNTEKHPVASQDYWKNLSHGADSIRPDILINGLAEISDNKNITTLAKGGILYDFGMIYAQHSRRKIFNKGLDKELDFENHDNYSDTVKIIKFLKKFHVYSEYLPDPVKKYETFIVADGVDESAETSEGIKRILLKKLKQAKGSYLLNLYARDTLLNMEDWEKSSESQKRVKIFEKHNQLPLDIAPGIVGYFYEDDLLICSNKGGDFRSIKLADLKMSKSEDELQSKDDKTLISDFIFLNSPESRKIIKKDIGINLNSLSLPEQANFLQFLYSGTEPQIKELKSFTEIYGSNGFKTFLSIEQNGLEMGEKILNIGESLKNQPETAQSLFAEYAGMANNAQKTSEEISKLYNEIFYDKQVNQQDVNQVILKRASGLLVDASEGLKQENLSKEDKKAVVDSLIEELEKEKNTQKNLLKEFYESGLELNKVYNKIHESLFFEFLDEASLKETLKNKKDQSAEYLSKKSDSEKDEFKKIKQKESRYDGVKVQNLFKYYDDKLSNFYLIYKQLKEGSENKAREFIESPIFLGIKKRVETLKTLLVLQQNFEKKFDQIVMGEFHAETDDQLMERYWEIQESVNNISETIRENFEDAEIYINPEEIRETLLREAVDVISTPTATEEDKIKASEKLKKINANVLLTGKIISQLPRDEVAKLDLKKITHIEKLEDISGKDLLNKPEFKEAKVLEKLQNIIRVQFPEGDDKVFEKECQEKNLEITITMVGGEILSFFTKERKGNGVVYLDWYLSNPEPSIKGLGESTLRLGFDSEDEKKENFYAIAKPHAKSFSILVEKQGFVGFDGQTLANEYIDYYARVRRLPSDAEFSSKNFAKNDEEEFIKTIEQAVGDIPELDKDGHRVKALQFKGKIFQVAEVIYNGQTHKKNISKDDSDGWIMAEMERLNKKGFVLTRFIPRSAEKEGQTFYAVFEKDNAPEEVKDKINEVINNRLKERGLLLDAREAPTPPQKMRSEAV